MIDTSPLKQQDQTLSYSTVNLLLAIYIPCSVYFSLIDLVLSANFVLF